MTRLTPSLGEIRLFAHNAVPKGWPPCEGQELQIADYQALFSIMGNEFGGDGQLTFEMPDLRGRVPIHTDIGEFWAVKK